VGDHCRNADMWGIINVKPPTPENTTTTTSPQASEPPNPNNNAAIKFVGDFKLGALATFIVLFLMKFSF